jgi:hypothetical protein
MNTPIHSCIVSVPLEVPRTPLPGPLHIEFLCTFTYTPPILLTGSPTILILTLTPLATSLCTLLLTLTSQLPLTSPLLLSQIPPEPLTPTPKEPSHE